ncbi:hypothetical protein H9L39_08603 [Fusarium oxysporum f. sp. albedinis]|nr:hypothetical protein H9L39_08603 [Fusarium oxysporum f. sp. albedinis]
MAACHVRAVARFVSTTHLGTRPGMRKTGLELGGWAMLVGGFLLEKTTRGQAPPKRNSLSAPTTGDESGTPPPAVLLPTVAVPLTRKFQWVACGHTACSAGYGWHTSSLRYLTRSKVLV